MPAISSETPPRGFERFRRKAARATRVPGHVEAIAQRAGEKIGSHRSHLRKLRDDLPILIRLSRAWARKEYRDIPWRSLVSAVAALLYFLSPIDLIPDLIPVLGFVDDAAVVAYVVKSLKDDLDAFRKWEGPQTSSSSSGTTADVSV